MSQEIIERLKEPSTLRGICAILTAFGVGIEPEHMESIVAGGLALMGLLGVFTRDRPKG